MLRRNEHSAVYTTIPPLLSKDGFRRCLYCGEPANTREHYPPVSRLADYMALGHDFYVIFGACSDCNSIAAAELDETIFDRIERIKDKIAKRGRKYTIGISQSLTS
jgi:5-methylcytosine-specific restriction endonuclease McrA